MEPSPIFLSRRGAPSLYLRALAPPAPKGAVVIVHGLGEHSGRYAQVMAALADHGYVTVACDLRGHGRSEGPRGHIEVFADFLDDVSAAIEWAKATHGMERPFLLGHSLGGLIALHGLARSPHGLAGLAVSSPALGIRQPVPHWKTSAGRWCSRWCPRMAFSNEVHPEHLSHDPAVVEQYRRDPLVHRQISARAFVEISNAMDALPRLLPRVSVPALFLVAGDDRLVDASATERLFAHLEGSDKQWRLYPTCFHELLNEPEREIVLRDLTMWLDQHILKIT